VRASFVPNSTPTIRHPEGIPKEKIFFEEEKVAALIVAWQKNREPDLFRQIFEASLPLMQGIIYSRRFLNQIHGTEVGELVNEAVIKLYRALPTFDPARGRAFTLLSLTFNHFFLSRLSTYRTRVKHFEVLPPEMVLELTGGVDYRPPELSSEFRARLGTLRTRFSFPEELRVQRYFLTSLLENGEIPSTLTTFKETLTDLNHRKLNLLRLYFIHRLRLLFEEDTDSRTAEDAYAVLFRSEAVYPGPVTLQNIKTLRRWLNDPEVWHELRSDDAEEDRYCRKQQEQILVYKMRILDSGEPEEVLLNPGGIPA
jgi:Sigma-70 region 2